MSRIIYVRNQEKSFDSIKELCRLQKESTHEDFIEDVNILDDEIQDNSGNIFVALKSSQRDVDIAKMTDEGGSWFDSFRGKATSDDTSAWPRFVEKISSDFHKRYSFLMCKYDDKEVTEEKQEEEISKILDIIQRHYPELQDVKVVPNKKIDANGLFGVSLRLMVTGGTGESIPILGRVFFKKDEDGEYRPVNKQDSASIDSIVNNAGKYPNKDMVYTGDGGSTRKQIITKLQELIDLEGLEEYLILGNAMDKEIIANIIKHGANSQVDIECTSVKVLSIIYVEWNTHGYDVFSNTDQMILKATFGMTGDSLNLKCVACNSIDSYLVKDGIEMPDEVFKKHLMPISCSHVGPTLTNCKKLKCVNSLIDFDGEYACLDCPYPEKVFEYEGQKYLTSNMVYASDLNTLVPSVQMGQCSVCKRTITISNPEEEPICPICKTIKDPSEDEAAAMRNRFRNAQKLLSPRLAMSLAKPKYCIEDKTSILFRIGESIYILDKEEINSPGYMGSPKRVK